MLQYSEQSLLLDMKKQKFIPQPKETGKYVFFYQKNKRANRNRHHNETDVSICR